MCLDPSDESLPIKPTILPAGDECRYQSDEFEARPDFDVAEALRGFDQVPPPTRLAVEVTPLGIMATSIVRHQTALGPDVFLAISYHHIDGYSCNFADHKAGMSMLETMCFRP
jgi:hypothetical protein